MDQFSGLGKILVIIGLVITAAGVIIIFFGKIPFLGKLPGDISLKGKNWSFYFPLASSILLSIILSLLMYLFRKIK